MGAVLFGILRMGKCTQVICTGQNSIIVKEMESREYVGTGIIARIQGGIC